MRPVRMSIVIVAIALTVGIVDFFRSEELSGWIDRIGNSGAVDSPTEPMRLPNLGSENDPDLFDLVRARTKLPEGLLVQGKAHLVRSPYSPDSGYIDVEGLEPGTKVLCHWTNKPFLIPDPGTFWIEWVPEEMSLPRDPTPGGGGKDDEKGSGVELFTRQYQVPSEWVASYGTEEPRPSSQEILERLGVLFEEGASAFYVPANSVLIVRNTEAQLEAADAAVSEVGGRLEN